MRSPRVTCRRPKETAVLNDVSVVGLGTLVLRGVRTSTSGQVLLLARDAVRSGHVQVKGLTVEAADVRGRVERPHGFGVDALQGAFWCDRHPDQRGTAAVGGPRRPGRSRRRPGPAGQPAGPPPTRSVA
ncbi:hypothetical protein [Streptomyces hygroscopicus]|uniref:hypothetical protein n=1 Tax=Streptomyces hygroscopicus TaxID=1912 RepID=UPI0036B26450